MRQLAHPLPEVEGCGGHEQVDGVTEHSFQEISHHAVVLFDVPDHGFDSGASAEAQPSLAALGSRIARPMHGKF